MSKQQSVNLAIMAARFSALGHPIRLELLRVLVRAGEDGMTVGQILTITGLAGSTQFHHLAALMNAGLVETERRGKEIVNRARFEEIKGLGNYLMNDCCKGHH
jgi:DNA-binding transcriptional ArsR family regulator